MGIKISTRANAHTRATRSGIDAWQLEVSDEKLMDLYLSGDHSAYSQLVHRYERELFSYLLRMVGDVSVAEDVFQNTFLTVHTKKHLYAVGRPFRPWLYTLATNQAIDTMRRNGRHQRASLDRRHDGGSGDNDATLLDLLAGPDSPPDGTAESQETARLVRSSVDELPEHLRSVIVLNYYQGLKYKEIAEVLSIPVGTVKSRLHAAIARLGEAWKKLGLVEDR